MLIDMKLTAESKSGANTLLSAETDRPEYPYGLRISLDDESLTKLGITVPRPKGRGFPLHHGDHDARI